jgi:SAM-dependent methyltransferase
MQIEKDFSLGLHFTFEPSKNLPVYNWLYYKEAFSPYVVERFVSDEDKFVYDPFCGIGTTLLKSKELGKESMGTDASSLAAFTSSVKTRDYSEDDIKELEEWAKGLDLGNYGGVDWKFELFSPAKAFPKRNLHEILKIREAIEKLDGNARGLALLALICILPMSSLIIKDGGVLKLDNSKRAGQAVELFKRKIRHYVDDLRNNRIEGPLPEVKIGSALNIERQCDKIITSPPYLNSIDYTKVYGLEISLLNLDKSATMNDRSISMPSFITKKTEAVLTGRDYIDSFAFIPVVGNYFDFTIKVIKEMHRKLNPGGKAVYVVADAVISTTYIPVDEICGKIAEEEGFESKVIVGLKRRTRINGRIFDTRESAVVMEK